MNKLEIYLSKDIDEDSICLSFSECDNIVNQFDYDSVKMDNFIKAVDFIIAFLYKHRKSGAVADIHMRNNELKPPKEMTIKEIEEKLGYKIKIVEEKGDVKMIENKIIGMLGDIRYAMFDILEDKELLNKVLLVIDDKMDLYRSKSNEDIAKELIEND